jgi:hypothetical protein
MCGNAMDFTVDIIDDLEAELVRNGGMVLAACQRLNIPPLDLERACGSDPDLHTRIAAARRVAASALEQEAWRRIFDLDERTKGSDTLLFKMMEKRLPDIYGDLVVATEKVDYSWGDQAPTASPDDDFGQVREEIK